MTTIILTAEQKGQLRQKRLRLEKAYSEGDEGVLLGQVFPQAGELRIIFIHDEAATEIIKILKKYGYNKRNR